MPDLLDLLDTRSLREELEVTEVYVKSALTTQPMESMDYGLNPYYGCSHACPYCYVPDTMHADRQQWGRYLKVKRNLPTVLDAEMRRKPPGRIFISTSTDPYQALEAIHKITRRCLQVILRHGWPLQITTRSSLVLRDLDLLLASQERNLSPRVALSVPTLDDNARKQIEPQAPSIPSRLRTLEELVEAGIETEVFMAPLMPQTRLAPSEIMEKLADVGAARIWIGNLRLTAGIRTALRDQLSCAGGDPDGLVQLGRVSDRKMMQRFRRDLIEAGRDLGLEVG